MTLAGTSKRYTGLADLPIRPGTWTFDRESHSPSHNSEVRISIEDFYSIGLGRSVVALGETPVSLNVVKYILLLLSLFFFSQFVLAFTGDSLIHGGLGLVTFVSLFGLYKVVDRICTDLKK
jgi:hypothetical protein